MISLFSGLAAAGPIPQKASFKRSGNQSLIRNVSYIRKYIDYKGKSVSVVVEKIENQVYTDSEEARKSEFVMTIFEEASAKKISGPFSKKIDALSFGGVGYSKSYFIGTKFGCCGAENTYQLIDFDGQTFAKFQNNAIAINLGQSSKNFRVFFFEKADSGIYGTLRHFDKSGLVQEVEVQFEGDEFRHLPWSPDIEIEVKNSQVIEDKFAFNDSPFKKTFRVARVAESKKNEVVSILPDLSLLIKLDCNDQVMMDLKVPIKNGLFYGKENKKIVTKIKKPKNCKYKN